jgi:hypothetical protein
VDAGQPGVAACWATGQGHSAAANLLEAVTGNSREKNGLLPLLPPVEGPTDFSAASSCLAWLLMQRGSAVGLRGPAGEGLRLDSAIYRCSNR